MMTQKTSLTRATLLHQFHQRFGTAAQVVRAPGRINLIGEHTDYNDGFVLPAAINFATWAAIAPRPDRRLVIHATNFAETAEFDLDEPDPRARQHWSDYPRGVAVMLERAGQRLTGANLLLTSSVPIGSGLSSSAALEVSTGLALLTNSGLVMEPTQLARLCQQAESQFVGLRCGIMDQFISCHGRAQKAILLDCRSLEFRALPVPVEARFVVCNSMVHHELASSEYNQRRAACEAGVQRLSAVLPGIRALRDVTLTELETHRDLLSDVLYRRCHHVISENARTLAAAEALEQQDLVTFGQLMYASHESLRDDYEVSCEELDVLVRLARQSAGVYGARLLGGGFGGCTINLVQAERAEEVMAALSAGYRQELGITPEIYVCTADNGAEIVA